VKKRIWTTKSGSLTFADHFMLKRLSFHFIVLTFALFCSVSFAAETFCVATYNVENYLDQPTESRRHVKSAGARNQVRESIRALNPDVLALEEMGTTNALLELRASLKAEGLHYPYWEHVSGWDTNIHVAILSKLPIGKWRPHTNDTFLLDGNRFRVRRGFAEVDIQAQTNFTFTLIAAHLKSRRTVPDADEAQLRLEEAKVLRGIVNEHFKADPDAKLIVLGDFNDVKSSDPIKTIIGHGRFKLVDTRPAERNGDNTTTNEMPRYEPRSVAWTHYYGVEDTYSRIDYILLSPAMARDWVTNGTCVLTIPNWGVGSDHRPIVAAFKTENN
jgi:endonuclease/exonuclease/phosphatase family metal-dependent hydrolase